MSTTTDNLPEYAVTVAEHGDPQHTLDELTAELAAHVPPTIMTWVLLHANRQHPSVALDKGGRDA